MHTCSQHIALVCSRRTVHDAVDILHLCAVDVLYMMQSTYSTCVQSTYCTWCTCDFNMTFPLPLPHIKSIPDIHTHSRPDTIQPSHFCVKSIPDISSVLRLRSGKARSHTSLARCVLVCPFSLSIYLYILYVSSLVTLRLFPPSHPQFPVSVNPCLIYLYSISPSTLFSYSVHSLRPIPDRSDQPDPYHTRTCINTLVTSCCSSV